MGRRIIGIVLALAGILAPQTIAPAADNAYEKCFRDAVNAERVAVGRPPLKRDSRLDALASAHSAEMAQEGTIFHNPTLARDVPSFAAVGENVGMGPSCPAIHEAFMESPGHRANIVDRDYTHLGVGVEARDDPDSTTGVRLYVTEVFFRPRMVAKPPAPPAKKPQEPGCPA